MAPRANWKGYLKLSLVSCGVALFPASSTSQRIWFNIVNRQTGNWVRYQQQFDSKTGEDVPEDDRVKGYKMADGSYALVQDNERDAVALEPTRTVDIDPSGSSKRGKQNFPARHISATAKLTPSEGKRIKRAS